MYSAEFHPKFQSGEWTEQQVLENWLSNFSQESGQYQVGQIYVHVGLCPMFIQIQKFKIPTRPENLEKINIYLENREKNHGRL